MILHLILISNRPDDILITWSYFVNGLFVSYSGRDFNSIAPYWRNTATQITLIFLSCHDESVQPRAWMGLFAEPRPIFGCKL